MVPCTPNPQCHQYPQQAVFHHFHGRLRRLWECGKPRCSNPQPTPLPQPPSIPHPASQPSRPTPSTSPRSNPPISPIKPPSPSPATPRLSPTSRSAPQPETPPDAPDVPHPHRPPHRHHNREDRPLTKTKPGQPKPNPRGRYPLQLSVDQPLFDALFSTSADFSRANPKTSAKVSLKLSLWFWDGAQHVDSYRRACD